MDCCPNDMFGLNRDKLGIKEMKRWRPIQVFIALTDNNSPNTGGFECIKSFHKKFTNYFRNKSIQSKESNNNDTICVGDFCRLLPIQDKTILSQYEHIPYKAGSLILFDYRIPHANARHNYSNITRRVIYTGFLPYIPLNIKYQKEQLIRYNNKEFPPDFWGNDHWNTDYKQIITTQHDISYEFNKLGKQLMGILPWNTTQNDKQSNILEMFDELIYMLKRL